MRHVIVEGCDGSGKTTLLELILNKRGGERAPKASTSLGGPVAHLASWVMQQEEAVRTRDPELPRLVYDRHPIISELIYGPIIRGQFKSWEFGDPGWVATRNLFIKQHFLVIWCVPPTRRIMTNVDRTRDMPGVMPNISRLAMTYRERARQWTGLSMVIDPFDMQTDDFLSHYDIVMGV